MRLILALQDCHENEKRESSEEINIEFEHRKDKYHIQKTIEDDINRIYLMRYTLVLTYFENLIKTCGIIGK